MRLRRTNHQQQMLKRVVLLRHDRKMGDCKVAQHFCPSYSLSQSISISASASASASPSPSLSLSLSLSFFSFFWTRNEKAPQAGSRQRQHSTAVRITVTKYPTMTKLNEDREKGDTSSWSSVKQEEANCHKAMDKTQLTSCILFKQRTSYCCACRPHHWGHRGTSTSVPLCRRPQSTTIRRHHSTPSTPPRPPSTPSTPSPSTLPSPPKSAIPPIFEVHIRRIQWRE